MELRHRLTAVAVAGAIGLSILAVPVSARASEEGRRNTALGLGAAAAVLLLGQRDKTAGVVAAAGAAYAYKRYQDSVGDRHNRERYGYYDDRYSGRYDRNRNYNDRYYDDRSYDSRYDRSGSYYNDGYYGDRGYSSRNGCDDRSYHRSSRRSGYDR